MSEVIAPVKKVVFGDEILQDPHPTYARLHEESSIHYLDVGSKWAEYGQLSATPSAPRLLNTRGFPAKRAQQMLLALPLNRQAEFRELVRMFSFRLIFMDRPEHARLRKLLNSLIKGSRQRRSKPCVAEFHLQ